MGVIPCLIIYPLIFKPIINKKINTTALSIAAFVSAVIGLQLGAFGVVLETQASAITELPFGTFVVLMQPIHLAIGIVEGIITAAVVWHFIRDTPSSVGLPELVAGENSKNAKDKKEKSAEYKSFIKKQVFRNPYLWIVAVSNFFVYLVRFAFVDWIPTMLPNWGGMGIIGGGFMLASFEAAGAVGMIVLGRITDKYFKGKGHRVCAIAMVFASFSVFMFWRAIETCAWGSLLAALASIGFCIYAAQSLILVVAANMATKRAAAVASGFVGIWGYASTVITGYGLGCLVDKFGWKTAMGVLTLLSIIGAIVLFFAWNAKATGYEELEAESK
jgi:OPA family glycerol-3-phosphate transporter-like MFS transporter/OPA family sugar phosphate sensor protein UhpC-like MFS transporter